MRMRSGSALAAIAVTLVALPSVVQAQSEDRLSADVSATAGYYSNPFSVGAGSAGSAVLGLDIIPRYQRLTARSTITISGDVGLQQYVQQYGRNDSYSVAADYQLRATERVTAHVRADLSSAVLGSAGAYLPGAGLGGATGTGAVAGGTTVLPATPAASLVPVTDIGLFGLRNRRRLARVSGDVSIGLSSRDSLTVSGYAEAARYSSLPQLSNYEGYSGSLGYSRRVSERFTLGLRGSASTYQYRSNNTNSRVFPLEVTLSGRLSPIWTIDGAAGVTFVDSGGTGSTRQTSGSGNVNLCRQGELSTLCIQASRQASPTGLIGTQYVTSAGANWSKRLSERENLSIGGSYTKIGGDNAILVTGLPLQTQYAQAVIGYDRRIRQRLRFVASANYRQLLDGNTGRSGDYGGQLGLSYRLGDPR